MPLFYDDREQGMPVEWMKRVKESLKNISANFDCQRMVAQYRDELYVPAHAAFTSLRSDHYEGARERVRWNRRVQEAWPRVRFGECGLGADGIPTGAALPMHADVDLAGLEPRDVRVEALIGRVGPGGEMDNPKIVLLAPKTQRGSVWTFSEEYKPVTTGRLGFAVRVSSNHFENPLNRPSNALLKWASR